MLVTQSRSENSENPTYTNINHTSMNANETAEENIIENTEENIKENTDDNSVFSIFKHITKLSLPMALSYTFSMEVFILTVLLSVISKNEDELASVALIASMLNTAIILGMSPIFGVGIVTSNQIGELQADEKNNFEEEILAQKRDDISQINKSALIIAGVITPAVIANLVFSKDLLIDVFKQNETSAELAQSFLRLYSAAVPGLMIRTSSEQILFSFGKSFQAMLMGLGSFSIGSAMAAWLGLGGLGIKSLGSKGLAIGFIIESYLTAAFYSLYAILQSDFKKFSFFNFIKLSSKINDQLKSLLKVGLPIAGTISTEIAASFVLSIVAGMIGKDEQIAMAAILQCVFFNLIISSAFGQGCSQEVSRLLGAGEYDQVSQVGKYGLLTSVFWTAPIPLVFGAAPSLLMLTSSDKTDVYPIVKTLAPIISTGVLIDSVRYNILQQLRGVNDNLISSAISASALTVGMLSGAMIGLKTKMGVYGLGAGYTGGMLLSATALGIRWINQMHPNKLRENDLIKKASVCSPGLPTFFNHSQKENLEPSSALINRDNQNDNQNDNQASTRFV